MESATIYEKVQERYGAAARSDDREYGRKVATAFGYTAEELTNIPEDANLGLSCGNPLALAKLREVSQGYSRTNLARCTMLTINREKQSLILVAELDSMHFSQPKRSGSQAKSSEST